MTRTYLMTAITLLLLLGTDVGHAQELETLL